MPAEQYSNANLRSYEAAGDQSSNQFKMMELQSDGQVDAANGLTDHVVGILMNDPSAEGSPAEVCVEPGAHVKLEVTAATTNISIGDNIGVNTDGTGLKVTSGKYFCKAQQAATATGVRIIVEWIGATDT